MMATNMDGLKEDWINSLRTYLSKGVGLRFHITSELETTGLQIPAVGEHWQERICFSSPAYEQHRGINLVTRKKMLDKEFFQ